MIGAAFWGSQNGRGESARASRGRPLAQIGRPYQRKGQKSASLQLRGAKETDAMDETRHAAREQQGWSRSGDRTDLDESAE